jgi:hypothetical protein
MSYSPQSILKLQCATMRHRFTHYASHDSCISVKMWLDNDRTVKCMQPRTTRTPPKQPCPSDTGAYPDPRALLCTVVLQLTRPSLLFTINSLSPSPLFPSPIIRISFSTKACRVYETCHINEAKTTRKSSRDTAIWTASCIKSQIGRPRCRYNQLEQHPVAPGTAADQCIWAQKATLRSCRCTSDTV